MSKEVWMTAAFAALGVAVVLVIRDNMPKGSFSLKKD